MPTPSSSSGNTTSVQVAVRIRPTTTHDLSSIPTRFQRPVIHATSNTSVSVDNAVNANPASGTPATTSSNAAKKQVFAFDQVLSPEATQYQLFTATAEPLINRFVEGFNCTILAYGQTSSGKTYSMTGVDLEADPADPTNGMGIIPRAVSTIFSRASETKRERGNAWQWSIKVSFIELYNEDLIDLLAVDDGSGRRDVQIREEKDGTIIWSGLREIPVRSAADVMAILARGTAHRRTNETDMNAQSSRSHAIFSVTLTQKKYSGSGTPPRSTASGRASPLPPPGTPSPSKIARPGSMYGGSPSRVASPTFGRQLPNSFGAAMNRGSTGMMLRPSSALGLRDRAADAAGDDEDRGEWTTVVSKFHFVDLAGSERLKRTAAAGERVKEGISINSGLLALGNVISALGDPSRAKTLGHGGSIHVPYRDSKLTRLLQDSLGGNAHTLMIACVSPSEWNHGETVNTLKYANRARNIRNRAEIREKEDGWDDLEWLQTMVTKLRKELKVLKDGGASASGSVVAEDETPSSSPSKTPTSTPGGSISDRSGGKVLKQYAELQAQYRNLRSEYVERNEELARLRKEMEEKNAPLSGAKRYEEIVGPVIEEYEKTITAMETEIKLSRTALEHTNEMYNEQENELVVFKERTANADSYIEALRSRLAKLAEREASTESYIRDLESKLKAHADAAAADDSAAELKKEIAKYKEAEGVSGAYISSLEQRLGRADTDIVALRSQVDKFEADLNSKDAAISKLQSRIDTMLAESEDMRKWQETLVEREKRVQDLERQMEEWEKVRAETGLHRQRLASTVSEVEATRRSLEIDPSAPSSPTHSTMTITPADSSELSQLREKHQSTLAELDSVSTKYRDALKEISDLAAQIAEAKLHSETSSEVSSSDAGTTSRSGGIPRSPNLGGGRRSVTRRETSDSLSSLAVPPMGNVPSSRRNFFRHAASSEGLHMRSQSQSLSSEFSSASFSRTSWGNGDSLLSPTSGSFRPIHRQFSQDNVRSSESLEKEIQSLQKALKDRETEIDVLEKRLSETTPGYFPVPPSGSTPPNAPLPEVREEVDVASQPDTLVDSEQLSPGITSQLNSLKQSMLLDERREAAERREAESISRLDELMRSMALKESQHVAVVDGLNDQLASLRREHEDLANTSREQAAHTSAQSQAMSSEIEGLRADLATSERRHSEVSDQFERLKTRERDLTESIQRAEEQHSKEMDELKAQHADVVQKHQDETASLIKQHEGELEALQVTLAETSRAHDEALVNLKAEHSSARDQLVAEHADALVKLNEEHDLALEAHKADTEAKLAALTAEHDSTLAKLTAEHQTIFAQQSDASEAALNRLRDDHADALRRVEISREGTLTESQERQAALLEQLQADHQSILERKEAEFKADLEKVHAEHERRREGLITSHSESIDKLQASVSDREAEIAQLKTDHGNALQERSASFETQLQALRDEHASTVADITATRDVVLENASRARDEAKAEHERVLAEAASAHEAALAKLDDTHHAEVDGVRAEQAIALTRLKAEHREALAAAQVTLASAQDEHRTALSQLREDQQAQIDGLREEHRVALAESESLHVRERDTLRKAHQLLEEEAAELRSSVGKLEDGARLAGANHAQELEVRDGKTSALEAELIAIKEEQVLFADTIQELQVELERTREAHANVVNEASKRQSVVSELEHHRSLLGDTQNELQRTRDSYDSLREEKARQDQLVAELKAQLVAMKTSRNGHLPPQKLPPLSPPPSIPPPPVPTALPPIPNMSATDSTVSSQTRSSMDGSEETHSSDRSSASTSLVAHSNSVDPKMHQQLIEQARHLEEQETMIKTLNKQLTHCESDLQAHMDLVATLETSLTDSERNLRKTRMQANEFSKERDRLSGEVDALRNQLQLAQQEIAETRRSIVEEKQNFETRLEEERRNKDRTHAQLERRMDEVQRKKSKIACL